MTKVLVAYASRHGATAEIAAELARHFLRHHGIRNWADDIATALGTPA